MSLFRSFLFILLSNLLVNGVHIHLRYPNICGRSDDWNYVHNGMDWQETCKEGHDQSPVYLTTYKSVTYLPQVHYYNYNLPFKSRLLVTNKGYTISLNISDTVGGAKPMVESSILNGTFVADELHFHWGDHDVFGSEHAIEGRRHDIEMHIVHRRADFPDLESAAVKYQGVMVLGILINIHHNPNSYSMLDKYFDEVVPKLIKVHSTTRAPHDLTLDKLLDDVHFGGFYSYRGSLTTPPCCENIKWIVFQEVLSVSEKYARYLFMLRNSHGGRLVRNYRKIQDSEFRYLDFYEDRKPRCSG